MRREHLVPVLVLVVALVHVVRVATFDQSAWQGGGFAMFVDYDSDLVRGVVAHAVVGDGGGTVPLDVGSVPDDLRLRARVTPGGPAPTRVAERLLQGAPAEATAVVVEVRGPERHPEGVRYRTIRRVVAER